MTRHQPMTKSPTTVYNDPMAESSTCHNMTFHTAPTKPLKRSLHTNSFTYAGRRQTHLPVRYSYPRWGRFHCVLQRFHSWRPHHHRGTPFSWKEIRCRPSGTTRRNHHKGSTIYVVFRFELGAREEARPGSRSNGNVRKLSGPITCKSLFRTMWPEVLISYLTR